MLVVRTLFEQLGLWDILDHCDGSRPPHLRRDDDEEADDDWISRVLVLVANRLIAPSSEHGLAGWLESDYVCDRRGRRYVPCWKEHGRVKVDFTQLQRWYRTLDHLIAHKERIELALFHRLRDLFSLQPEPVFYDVTSTYFEGRGPKDFARHGHSRDGKPRNVQVVVGMVMVAGWPIAHHVWAGNTADKTTVGEVLEDLSERFAFGRVVLVGDRGMVSTSNLAALKAAGKGRGFGFLLGLTRRRNPEVESLLGRVDEEAWIDCPVGICAQEQATPPRTRVQEVSCERSGVRVFVVDSDERRAYEQRLRKQSMARAQAALGKVRARVASGRLKDPAKIGAAVERALQRHHGHSLLRLEADRGALGDLRASGAFAAGETVRGQVPDPDGSDGHDGGGGRDGLQTTQRRGAWVSEPEGSDRDAADLPSRGESGACTHLRGGVGVPDRTVPGSPPEGRGCGAVSGGSLVGAGHGAARDLPGRPGMSHRGDDRLAAGPPGSQGREAHGVASALPAEAAKDDNVVTNRKPSPYLTRTYKRRCQTWARRAARDRAPGPAEGAWLKLPGILGSNMVLQRGQPAPIWGWAAPGREVAVQFADGRCEPWRTTGGNGVFDSTHCAGRVRRRSHG